MHLEGRYYKNHEGHLERKRSYKFNKSIYDSYYDTFNELVNYGHKIIFIYPIPELGISPIIQFIDKDFPKEPIEFFKKRTDSSYKLLNSIKSDNIARVYPSDFLCDENYCYSMIDNKIVYSDDDHLNQNGVNLIVPEIIKKVNQLSSP